MADRSDHITAFYSLELQTTGVSEIITHENVIIEDIL